MKRGLDYDDTGNFVRGPFEKRQASLISFSRVVPLPLVIVRKCVQSMFHTPVDKAVTARFVLNTAIVPPI